MLDALVPERPEPDDVIVKATGTTICGCGSVIERISLAWRNNDYAGRKATFLFEEFQS
jgi:hypothetical protein